MKKLLFQSERSKVGWSKSSKIIPSASPQKLRVFWGLASKIPQEEKLFEGYPRKYLKRKSFSRSQPQNSRVSRLPLKKPQMCKMAYFSRILEKSWFLKLFYEQNKSFFRGFLRNPRKSSTFITSTSLWFLRVFQGTPSKFSQAFWLSSASIAPRNFDISDIHSQKNPFEIGGRGFSRFEASIDHPTSNIPGNSKISGRWTILVEKRL